MAKSVRVSDDLYALASEEAGLMHRSVAQQIEHWAAIGRVLEARGDMDAVREASIAFMRMRDHVRVKRGRVRAEDLFSIPRERIKTARLRWPENAFAEYDRK